MGKAATQQLKPHTVCLWCHQVGLAGIATSGNVKDLLTVSDKHREVSAGVERPE